MSEEKKPRVSIELGASAKAEFKAEIRGEIPSSSVGRMFDALTDAIRPFTEKRGLRADEIRLQREDVLLMIAERAQERLRIENREADPVPNRVLIPFLEKASWTDPEDTKLQEAWANVLAARANPDGNEKAIFVDILSKITAKEALLLEDIVLYPVTNVAAISTLPDAPVQRRFNPLYVPIVDDEFSPDWFDACARFVMRVERRGAAVLRFYVWDQENLDAPFEYYRKGENETEVEEAAERLRVLGLLDFVETNELELAGCELTALSVYLTYLGVQFFFCTHNAEYQLRPEERKIPSDFPDNDTVVPLGEILHSDKEVERLKSRLEFSRGVWRGPTPPPGGS